ncbi:hypothetical protein KKA47_03345, partial [bacterium]|nr:hypothetical protein [bacterium]
FYWSLEGSLAGLELDKTAQKFIPESKLGLLHKRLREICLEKEFIKPEDLKEGGAIPISDRPKFAFDASQTPTASYEFAGGVRHFHQQYLELPSGFKVPVQHHGVMVRQLNNMKKPAPEFNGLRDLSEINSSINLKPEDAKAKMFNTLKIIMGDASKFNFVINEKIGERSPVNTKLYKDIMTDFVNNTKMKDVKGEPVIIDGKNTIQYKFEVGPLTMYIDAFDPKAEPYFESNIIIN